MGGARGRGGGGALGLNSMATATERAHFAIGDSYERKFKSSPSSML